MMSCERVRVTAQSAETLNASSAMTERMRTERSIAELQKCQDWNLRTGNVGSVTSYATIHIDGLSRDISRML